MRVDRRDSATLISIGALPLADSLRIGTEGEWGGWKSGFEEGSRE